MRRNEVAGEFVNEFHFLCGFFVFQKAPRIKDCSAELALLLLAASISVVNSLILAFNLSVICFFKKRKVKKKLTVFFSNFQIINK